MSTNYSIESPDFDAIREETGHVTSNAVKLLWSVLNYELSARRKGVKRASDRLQGKIITDVATAAEDNLDLQESLVWWYNTAASFNVSGFRNGIEGRVVFIHNVGAGTITFLHNSVASDAANRLLLQAALNKAIATNKSIVFSYINTRWREIALDA